MLYRDDQQRGTIQHRMDYLDQSLHAIQDENKDHYFNAGPRHKHLNSAHRDLRAMFAYSSFILLGN